MIALLLAGCLECSFPLPEYNPLTQRIERFVPETHHHDYWYRGNVPPTHGPSSYDLPREWRDKPGPGDY